jgi:hypothetical protein
MTERGSEPYEPDDEAISVHYLDIMLATVHCQRVGYISKTAPSLLITCKRMVILLGWIS